MLQQSNTVQRWVSKAGAHTVLAGAAILSCALYWVAFSAPFNLVQLAGHPQFSLRSASGDARWWLVGAFVMLGALYLMAWEIARHVRGRAAWAIVLGGSAASAAALLLMFPYGAADIFDYIVHGRVLSIYGQNPYVTTGGQLPRDPLMPYMGWGNDPSTYGPLWVLLSGGAAWLAGDSVVVSVITFKLLAGSFLAGGIAIVAATLRQVAPERALQGTLLLAWNPLVLYETFGNGHNDMAMIVWALAATWLLLRGRSTLAVLALVAGTLIKFFPLLLVPAAGLYALRREQGWRARTRFVLVTAAAGAALVAVTYAPFWRGWATLTVLERKELYTTSLPAVIYYRVLEPAWGTELAAEFLSKVAAGLTGLWALWQARRCWHDQAWDAFPQAALRIAIFYLLLTCMWFQEWYTIWPLAIAALLPSRGVALLTVLLNFAALAKPLIVGPLLLWRSPLPTRSWYEPLLGPGVLGIPWLTMLALGMRRLVRAMARMRRIPQRS